MIEENSLPKDQAQKDSSSDGTQPSGGPISQWMDAQGLQHIPLNPDHIGIELVKVEPLFLYEVASALKDEGFDYLQCQGGYDEGLGKDLVCFYNLVALSELAPIDNISDQFNPPREVRLKVFLPRDGELKVPSLYKLFKGSDWQERETFDMFGINFLEHPDFSKENI